MRKIVSNKFMQKTLNCYGDDIASNRKDRKKSKIVRARLKTQTIKEIKKLYKGGKL